jgi:hypothetical protein
MKRPLVSFVIATHGRREVVARTIAELSALEIAGAEREIIAVDNASTDGTAEALARCGDVRLIPLRQNQGSTAKAFGVDAARGQYIVFLDDDSYPQPGAIDNMLAHFHARPTLGAVGFTVHLPDGSQECAALPHVFVGCGVGFRREALREVGGLDPSFFMQAEEYDLSFRLLRAGWDVEIFGDCAVTHLKTPFARRNERTTYYDVRNNLRVLARYFPKEYVDVYREDWLQRYEWMAENAGHTNAFLRGWRDGRRKVLLEKVRYKPWTLTTPVLERLLSWKYIEQKMRDLADAGVRQIVLADLGKNAFAFYRGAVLADVKVRAIADDQLADPERHYRGIPIVPVPLALQCPTDAVVISNTSYVHAERRAAALARLTARPVHNWFPGPQQTLAWAPDAVSTPRTAG